MIARAKRCPNCPATVVWLTSPFTGRDRMFNARPVDGRTHVGPPAYPVEGQHARRPRDLVEDLQVRRQVSVAEAQQEAYDMPWYVLHACPNRPSPPLGA